MVTGHLPHLLPCRRPLNRTFGKNQRLIMAKKAKRRGRPPGAKSPDKMDIGQLRQYIDRMENLLKQKVSEQRSYLEEKLSELSGYASAKASGVMRTMGVSKKKGTRRKATPK